MRRAGPDDLDHIRETSRGHGLGFVEGRVHQREALYRQPIERLERHLLRTVGDRIAPIARPVIPPSCPILSWPSGSTIQSVLDLLAYSSAEGGNRMRPCAKSRGARPRGHLQSQSVDDLNRESAQCAFSLIELGGSLNPHQRQEVGK